MVQRKGFSEGNNEEREKRYIALFTGKRHRHLPLNAKPFYAKFHDIASL
jgi:hypothetical protein